jgi:hypothetical protein
MKTIIQIILLIFISSLGLGCTTPYMVNRGRDAVDIVTVQVGYGGGAKARVGFLQLGCLVDIGLGGIRGGAFQGKNEFWPIGFDTPSKLDLNFFCFGTETFGGNKLSNHRGKSYVCRQTIVPVLLNPESDIKFRDFSEKMEMKYNPWSYYTQIEAVVAIGPSIRLGFNPGELLDFILGWTTIDIFNDDIEQKKSKE